MEHYFTNNSNLRSEIRSIGYESNGIGFTFFSDLGVFSKNKIDYGSRVLVQTVLKNYLTKNIHILDVGCGYGFIGIVLGKILDSDVTLIDVNKRAVHLAERNLDENKVNGKSLVSDGYHEIHDSYDMIVTNPPIRAGKAVVLRLLSEAKEHLNPGGVLWFVIRKDQGVKSMIKLIEKDYKTQIMEKSKGFYVVMAEIR